MYYSIDMRLKSWMPSFVKNVLKNQALTQVRAAFCRDSHRPPRKESRPSRYDPYHTPTLNDDHHRNRRRPG